MAITQQALAFLQSLFLGDEAAVKEYNNDPAGALERHGLASCSPVEINQAVAQLAPGLPGEAQARANAYLSSTQGVGGYTNGGPSQAAQGAQNVDAGKYGSSDPATAAEVPPSLQAVSTEINYITQITQVDFDQVNNFTDNSVNQVIVAGGDVNQTFDQDTTNVTASGDGAVAAGRDAQGVNTGVNTGIVARDAEDAFVGDGNVVGQNTLTNSPVGDGNTVNDNDTTVFANNSNVGLDGSTVQGVNVQDAGFGGGLRGSSSGDGGGDITTNFGDGGSATNADVNIDGGGSGEGGTDLLTNDSTNVNVGGTQTVEQNNALGLNSEIDQSDGSGGFEPEPEPDADPLPTLDPREGGQIPIPEAPADPPVE